jgi:hypothetical protein
MTAAPVVQRAGFKSGRLVGVAGPTLEELAAMPPWFARAVFGVAVIPLPIHRLEAQPRRPEPSRPRTALGSGVVRVGRVALAR